jgi:hypothetical protein
MPAPEPTKTWVILREEGLFNERRDEIAPPPPIPSAARMLKTGSGGVCGER